MSPTSAPSAGPMRVALSGDSVATRRLPRRADADYQAVSELLRSCDAAFTNLEVVLASDLGYPDPYFNLAGERRIADDLRTFGIGMASFAHNHALNFGPDALLATVGIMDDAGIVAAGAGSTLKAARQPRYVETAHGRLALIACTSTFLPHEPATDAAWGRRARPGINPLRHRTTLRIDEAALRELTRIDELTGLARRRERQHWIGFRAPLPDDSIELLDRGFVVGSTMGEEVKLDASDLTGHAEAIAEARRHAEVVVVSVHTHEFGQTEDTPPDFIRAFTHAAIDAGADIVVAHGPHLLRGIEVYRDRPIFHSLANLIFQYELVDRVPGETFSRASDRLPSDWFRRLHHDGASGFPADERYWEAVLPVCTFEGGRLAGIELVPIELGFGNPPARRGLPRLARDDVARRIVRRLAALSKPFGTSIDVSGDVATVALPEPISERIPAEEEEGVVG